MLFFFTVLIALPILLIIVLKQEGKNIADDCNTIQKKVDVATTYYKEVYGYCDRFYQTYTGKAVYKEKDSKGREWWYYLKTHEPMEYVQRSKMVQDYNFNAAKAIDIKKKWFVLEDYWDTSIVSTEPYIGANSVYLDDYSIVRDFIRQNKYNKYMFEKNKTRYNGSYNSYANKYSHMSPEDKEKIEQYFKDNSPYNQKIYCKNMRPYQLTGIINPSDVNALNNIYTLKKNIHYLIRFRKGNYYLDRQRNINEKTINELWTKWYAISEEEYKNLTNLVAENLFDLNNIDENIFEWHIETQYNKVKDRIGFKDGINSLNWSLKDLGIKKAFDEKGNFIGEDI